MRVLLADDQLSVRSALRLLLENESELEIVGEVDSVLDLLAQTQKLRPDLVLLDWELPDLQAQPVILGALRLLCPNLQVVILSGYPEVRERAISAGADAFISKGDSPEKLLAALHTIAGWR